MSTFQIEVPAKDIHINPQMIARLMGVDTENIPEPYGELIQTELKEIGNYNHIMGGYRISDNIKIETARDTFLVEGERFDAGKQVVNKLKRSESLAIYICTAGEEVSIRSKELMNSGSFLEGYIADLVGSVVVEEAMDVIFKKFASELGEKGLKTTNRYSPGYCDWKVSEQHKLFKFFPENFCGVQLSESSLMHPIESVSGVFGIGKEVRFHKYVCHACSNVKCIYRDLKYA
jgi:hypothetical protein